MVDEEQPNENTANTGAPSGPRRSTFTPLPAGTEYDPAATDDDALAGALAQDFERWAPATGSVETQITPEPAPEPGPPAPAAPVAPTPAPVPAPAESTPVSEWSTAAPDLPEWSSAAPEPAEWSMPAAEPAQWIAPAAPEPAQWVPPAAPEPEPALLSEPAEPVGPIVPPPPTRESLTDAELLAAADLGENGHDTSALLDLVERELELRKSEARRLAEWEAQVRDAAGPEAEAVVAEVRTQFTDVIPSVPTPIAVDRPSVEAPPVDLTPVDRHPLAPLLPDTPTSPAPALDLDLALADAPPPYGVTATSAPPPPGAMILPPPLVEPDALPESATPERWSLDGDIATSTAVATASAASAVDAALVGGALFDDLLREPELDVEFAARHGDAASTTADLPHLPDLADVPDTFSDHGAIASNLDLASAQPAPVDPAMFDAADRVVTRPSAARVETTGLEPTPAEHRAGRSVRLFWLWFAVNASVVSLGLGAVILGLGMSLRQAVLAALVGVALSFLPLGLGTLAGKWSGQPTMVVSRATFGTVGNAIPALIAVVSRLLWSAALIWMLGAGVAEVLVGSGLVAGLGRFELTLIAAGAGLVLAALVAGFGFAMIAVVGAIVSVVAGVLVIGLIVLTLPFVDLSIALSVPDGSWLLVITGAVLVFSVVGLAWAQSSGDLARYQAKGTYGSAAVLWSSFGATIPAFLLIAWGAILAASNPYVASELSSNPVDLVSRLLPLWYPVPLVLAVGLGLLAAASLALYSGGFALLATGLRAPRAVGVLIGVLVTGALVAALVMLVPDLDTLFRDVVTTMAVPVAAWAGIFGAETMIRTRRVHSPSLLRSGGVYPAIRWVNLVMLLVASAVGWGFTSAAVTGLAWQGYLWALTGLAGIDALASSDSGVLISLLVGLLTPIVAGIPSLRRLQRAEREAAGETPGEAGAPTPAAVVSA